MPGSKGSGARAPAGKPQDISNGVGLPLSVVVPVSFETGEICSPRIYFPGRVRITKVSAIVTKAIAGTEAATAQLESSAGSLGATGLITLPLSSALNTVVTNTPTGSNRTIGAGSYVQITCAKATAGGKALLTIEYVPVSLQE